MTEFEKMRREEFYDFTSEECLASYYRAKHICAKLQAMTTEDADYRETIEALIPGIPDSSTVSPPFHCDHGHGIKLGENVFINYNGTMLDGGLITIGSNTQVGPNCQFLTPNHPIDSVERRKPVERCSPITIGEDCWLGGGIEKNLEECVFWYELAANGGDAQAQFATGWFLMTGTGVPKDERKGLKWIHKATFQGYQPAIDYCKEHNLKWY